MVEVEVTGSGVPENVMACSIQPRVVVVEEVVVVMVVLEVVVVVVVVVVATVLVVVIVVVVVAIKVVVVIVIVGAAVVVVFTGVPPPQPATIPQTKTQAPKVTNRTFLNITVLLLLPQRFSQFSAIQDTALLEWLQSVEQKRGPIIRQFPLRLTPR